MFGKDSFKFGRDLCRDLSKEEGIKLKSEERDPDHRRERIE
jgi:hypothetical protein